MIALVSVLATALYLLRSRSAVLHPQLIAEDGVIFFTEAKLYGLASLKVDYAGYLHFLPRLVAFAATFFPSPDAPAFYVGAATVIVGWTAITIASVEYPFACVLAPLAMLAPVGGEVFGTLTNVQWLTQAALVLVAITPTPHQAVARWNQLAFTLAASFTGPFSIFIAPFVIWRVLRHRADRHSWAIGTIILVGAVVQLSYALPQPSPYEGDGVHAPLHLAITMLDRWIGQAAHSGRTTHVHQWNKVALLTLSVLAAVLANRRFSSQMFIFSAIVLFATFTRFMPDGHAFDSASSGERYFYMPRLAVLWVLALCLLRLRPSSVAAAAGIALMMLSVQHWQRLPDPRVPWKTQAAAIDRGEPVHIVINPSPAGDTNWDAWAVTLPGKS